MIVKETFILGILRMGKEKALEKLSSSVEMFTQACGVMESSKVLVALNG